MARRLPDTRRREDSVPNWTLAHEDQHGTRGCLIGCDAAAPTTQQERRPGDPGAARCPKNNKAACRSGVLFARPRLRPTCRRKPHRPISRAMGACSAHQPTSCKSSKGTEPRGKRGSDALIGIDDRTPRLLALLDTCAACRELNCAMQTLFWVEVILVGILTLAAYSRAFETLLGATIENIGKFLGVAGLAVLVVIFASQCLEWLRFGT